MVRPVSREEGDRPVAHRADRDRRGGRPERCLDLHRLGVLEELVEAGAADYADLRPGLGHDAAGSFFEDFDDFSEEPLVDESFDDSLVLPDFSPDFSPVFWPDFSPDFSPDRSPSPFASPDLFDFWPWSVE
jgi:hypothetical protein